VGTLVMECERQGAHNQRLIASIRSQKRGEMETQLPVQSRPLAPSRDLV